MNNITIAGQLGRDAEIRHTQGGDSVLSFSVADNQGREKPTIWWNCQMWGVRALSLAQHMVKSQAVTVSGTLSEREWTDKEGVKHKSMEVRVNNVALQGGKREAAPAKAAAGGDDFDGGDLPF